MSIELELRLEGEDANEDTLLDLIDWLGKANIDGLAIQQKTLPAVEEEQSTDFDTATLIMFALATPPTIVAIGQLTNKVAEIFTQWQDETEHNVSIEPKLKNTSAEIEQIKQQIQAILEEMRQKCQKHK
ncbi:MAG TPA: hypothetical protein ENG03_07140 [Thioploca sp.]|nr:MAG: hypothetical protein DRR19_27715 [Gammaproteobacteria bacterium]HDN26858.1 hypothetical protein [Thioploca sp.]